MKHNRVTHCTRLFEGLLRAQSPSHFLALQATASGIDRISITFCAINFRRSILLLLTLGLNVALVGCSGSGSPSTNNTPVVAIKARAGTGQTATVGAAFGSQLQATVTTNESPASGMTVTFTAPASGASGVFATTSPSAMATITTNSSGVAIAPAFTADTIAGAYTVIAMVSGVSTPASFSLTNTAGPVTTISAVSGSGQTATVGAAFGSPLVATVLDSDSKPVEGATVTFTAPSSGASGTFASTASATASATTDSSGSASAPAFTADATAGTYAVMATVTGASAPASFGLTNAGVAATITATSGSGQMATVGTQFAAPLVVTVLDSNSNPLSGAPVTFTAQSSSASGTFATAPPSATATAITNGQGFATSPKFTANGEAGAYTVAATISSLPPADFVLINSASAATTLNPGIYVFSMTGTNPTFSYSVAGAFTVAAGGAITGGEQDLVEHNPTLEEAMAFSDPILNSSTYAISADGNLTITLVTGDALIGINGNGTEILNATLLSSQRALITEFDSSATASGSMALQSNPSTPVGGYAFYLSGQGFYQYENGTPQTAAAVIGGILNFDGSGGISISSSIFDVNDAVNPDYLNQIFLSGSVSTTPDSFGRITVALIPNDFRTSDTQPITLIGYIVDSGSIRLVETTDTNGGILGGIALAQTGTFTNGSLSGSSYVFGMSGVRVLAATNTEPMQLAGVLTFTADSGSSTTGTVNGTLSYNDFTDQNPQGGSAFTGVYTLDTTDPGRITVSNLTAGLSLLNFNLQFYLTGDGHALIIAVDYSVLAGTGFQQSGSFSAATFSGNYAVNVRQSVAFSYKEHDGVGPVTADGVGIVAGFIDLNEVSPTPEVTLSGNFVASTNGVFTGSITGVDFVPTAKPDNFTFYIGDSSNIIAIETDANPNQLTLGYLELQQ